MGAGAPKENKNAEKWTYDKALELFNKCLDIAKDNTRNDNDFIGEVAQAAETTLYKLKHLKGRFTDLDKIYAEIKSHCEANCYANAKNGKIVASLGIINLKSNHGWTDRLQTENKTEKVVHNYDYSQMSDETLKEIANLRSVKPKPDVSEGGTL